MLKPYLERLADGVLLFDGAVGTMLYEKGVFLNQCFEHVTLTSPEKVSELHREMIAAGAQAVTTNTFGANRLRLDGYGLSELTGKINREAVRLAREAAGKEVYVAGSVGPLGKRVGPVGKIDSEEARSVFREQMEALAEAGIDLFVLETFRNIDELLLAAETAKATAPEIPVQAQYSFRPLRSEQYNNDLTPVFARLQESEHVDVLGINCSTGPAHMLDVILASGGVVSKPISVMPNAGYPRDYEGRQLYMASPDYFAEYALKFLDAGVHVIGGCCGTTPLHIQKMAQAILHLDSSRHKGLSIEVSSKEIERLEPVALEKRSAFGAALAKGEWITTVELVPPMGIDLSKAIAKAKTLGDAGITCVNVPDGPRASSRISTLVTCMEIQRNSGVETIQHICCRDKNLIGIQSELLGAQTAGVHNLLLLTGDPPKVGNFPDATGVFDTDSIGLLSLADSLNQGIDLAGNRLHGQTSFVAGAGANPAAQVLEREVERAWKKAEAGAEYFITQPVFDVELLSTFLDKIKGTGKPVIAGIWPLASYRNALFLHYEVPGISIPADLQERMKKHDTKEGAMEEGILIAREIIAKIRGRVAGVQVSPPFGRLEAALQVIKNQEDI
ncbi:bifunctional homocysteine S-methyltransferase/methylenetetrahydrofolate reductase [Sediminispirochaeta smaragdinae]|jgi:homocysteine S-methyltransferase|uniref:Homocysteine S-methyltransferase n=1 Tax=Sediminispirochaeta smaragdinae (strain DSM 11293 / JCM 15392 / SEBR 4228) TaxID=573413 RepID=E1RA39_SEDSS|nr:bifunctional homocysteine S-methyltransferase/methylenetetrahydrofolate reductase [Sediminispirochaeta smaragdinae]ADK83358.1 homocysteine S-methyltransferase [Sediminispirochaeta smaragdinae DSM 11293]